MFLLFLVIASDMIGAGISGWILWRRRNGGITAIAILCWAIFIRGACEFAANACGFERTSIVTTGYAWFYWTGRGVFTIAIWWFVLYLLGPKTSNK